MKVRHKVVRMLAVGASAAAVSLIGGGAAHAAQVTTTPVTPFAGVFNSIRNVGNNGSKCLQPEFPVVNAKVVQEPCDASNPAQGWQSLQVGTNHYRFINQGSGLCLNAFTAAANGSPMGLSACRNVSNEEFNTHTSLPDVVSLESRIGFRNTGFCIDVPGGRADNGLQMQLFRCNGSLAQRWVVGFDA
ncbi:MAG: RICIN domain-containing protein [Sciscionella sp.]